ncbi:MAG: hypothetical protein ACE37B_10350 [Ilumatobacter sp.]|jgi:hypothetical protein|uniref:hypothetical protein n=1 Tax=Ilumatobacter sp. TaxID=1967498 RepID=UPI00391C8C60
MDRIATPRTGTPRLALDRVAMPRRTFLIGAVSAGLLTACGGDGESESTLPDVEPESDTDGRPVAPEFAGDSSELAAGTFTIVQRFPSAVLVPGEVRLPHSLVQAADFVNDGPLTLGAQVVDVDGNPIGERLTATRLDITPSAYYVWRPTVDEPGIYALVVDGGPEEGASFQVFEPSQVPIPLVGDVLEGFETPTVDDPAGVEPVCTREPICPFHEVTLAEALASGRHVAYMVGTPAFCQTGTCAPALESLIGIEPEFADDFVFVHAEVFTDLTAAEIAPAVTAVGMNFEPALFITDASGVIVDRLDAVWGADELRERLSLARG